MSKREQQRIRETLPAYSALKAMFRAWLEAENVRAGAAAEKVERELRAIRWRVIEERRRFNLAPDFDLTCCSLDPEAVQLFKRYLALCVLYDEESYRHSVVEGALVDGDIDPAYREFITCYDDHHNDLHGRMLEEMFADDIK